MKQLRIMSGTHAGATLDLSPGNHSLGKNDDTQITITDWAFDALNVLVGNDGTVTAQWAASGAKGLPLADFVPVDFNGIVVCLGPQQGSWPDDDKLVAATQKASADGHLVGGKTEKRRNHLIPAGVAVMVALVAGGWLLAATSKPKEVPPPTLEAVRTSLQNAIDKQLGGHLLEVTAERGSLLIDGMVDSPEQAKAFNDVLAAQAPRYPLVQKVSVATDVAEAIRSSVGLPGAEVTYKGNGAFSYTVKAPDVAVAQASLDRVKTDLAPVVKRIDAVLEETTPRSVIPRLLSSWSADGVSVMETRDGVKHLVITDAPADAPVLTEAPASIPSPISGEQAANSARN